MIDAESLEDPDQYPLHPGICMENLVLMQLRTAHHCVVNQMVQLVENIALFEFVVVQVVLELPQP